MKDFYSDLISDQNKRRRLAVLIDPDKCNLEDIQTIAFKINQSIISHVFIGGSTVNDGVTESLIYQLKKYINLPVIIFPGDPNQISEEADGILFLSLISGRNPDYLIGKQVEAVSKLRHSNLEVISTGYILVENGKKTSVERVSKTKPMLKSEIDTIVDTAKAGELLGLKCIYLEAGSGAETAVSSNIIRAVKRDISIPLIVGGGIRSKAQMELAYEAGADLVVIGTAFENDPSFFEAINNANNLTLVSEATKI